MRDRLRPDEAAATGGRRGMTAPPLTAADGPPWTAFDTLLACLAGAGAALAVVFTAKTLHQPIVEEHGFRQTQTAIAVYYALTEGALIDYQTPVLGSPWSLPHEAPVYQAMVAAVATLTGTPIEPVGRLVSFACFVGALVLAGATLRLVVSPGRRSALVFAGLALASPLYLFWSRAFLIETCALFFAVAWLYVSIRATRERRPGLALCGGPLATLAVLAKLTTWPAFLAGYGAYWLCDRRRPGGAHGRVTAAVAAGVLCAGGCAFAWQEHAAELRSAGPIARQVTSIPYLVGTWEERLGSWTGVLPHRMLPDLLGVAWPVALVALARVTVMRRRDVGTAATALALFLLPLLVFTHVQLIHDYYQVANGLFLLAAVAILVAGVSERHERLAAIVCLALVIGQVARFAGTQWPTATRDLRYVKGQPAASFVERHSAPGSSLVVLGMDWSPQLHYYARRKGLAVPHWVSADVLRAMLADPEAAMGGLPLGAVVQCRPSPLDRRPELAPIIDGFLAGVRQRMATSGGRVKHFNRCTAYVLDVGGAGQPAGGTAE